MTRMRRGATLLLVVLPALAGCGESRTESDGGDVHIMDFATATVRLVTARDTVPLTLELAVSADQQRLGLMERRHLPERAGMLFVYDSTQPPDAGFWMYRTRIPLDIAFLDSTGVVRAVRSMVPCPTTMPEGCPSYAPDTPYRYALEVNGGALARWGAGLGARLLLGDVKRDVKRDDSARARRAP